MTHSKYSVYLRVHRIYSMYRSCLALNKSVLCFFRLNPRVPSEQQKKTPQITDLCNGLLIIHPAYCYTAAFNGSSHPNQLNLPGPASKHHPGACGGKCFTSMSAKYTTSSQKASSVPDPTRDVLMAPWVLEEERPAELTDTHGQNTRTHTHIHTHTPRKHISRLFLSSCVYACVCVLWCVCLHACNTQVCVCVCEKGLCPVSLSPSFPVVLSCFGFRGSVGV